MLGQIWDTKPKTGKGVPGQMYFFWGHVVKSCVCLGMSGMDGHLVTLAEATCIFKPLYTHNSGNIAYFNYSVFT